MVDREKSVDQVLAANRGENYCTDCLGQSAGFTLEEQVIALARKMKSSYQAVKDRVVERGVCGVCGRAALIVRFTGSRPGRTSPS
jgi:hypothetical protein